MTKNYNIETIKAAARVSGIFQTGCDRCSLDDLHLLVDSGLMGERICTKEDERSLDSLQRGEPLFEFNTEGIALCDAIKEGK